jgi:hypothetical protein
MLVPFSSRKVGSETVSSCWPSEKNESQRITGMSLGGGDDLAQINVGKLDRSIIG